MNAGKEDKEGKLLRFGCYKLFPMASNNWRVETLNGRASTL